MRITDSIDLALDRLAQAMGTTVKKADQRNRRTVEVVPGRVVYGTPTKCLYSLALHATVPVASGGLGWTHERVRDLIQLRKAPETGKAHEALMLRAITLEGRG